MPGNHYEKWLFKTLIGFLLVGGGVFFMYYSLVFLHTREDWVVFAIVSSLSIGAGIFLLSSAAVNKVKSDMIKKQKMKNQSG